MCDLCAVAYAEANRQVKEVWIAFGQLKERNHPKQPVGRPRSARTAKGPYLPDEPLAPIEHQPQWLQDQMRRKVPKVSE